MDQARAEHAKATGLIIAILGMLAAFAPMATDMYLPAFDVMAGHFGGDEGDIAVTLSVFFLGMSIGQAIYGPIIDRFGRRLPLLVGIGLYVLSTLACLATSDIQVFTALRFLQAVGGCAGMIVGRAIVSDLFDEKESARALSLLMVVMTLAPIVAPILGGQIVTHAGWKAIFVVMLAFGVACAVLVWRFVPETLAVQQRRSDGASAIVRTWWALCRNRGFIVPTVVGGLAQACMFAFITGSPFVFITLHEVSAQGYGWLFALIAGALIVAAQGNRLALQHASPVRILGAALVVCAAAGVASVAAASTGNLILLLAALWLSIGALGFIGANATAVAMAASGPDAGMGSSLIGVLQFGCAFLISSIVAVTQDNTAYPMTMAIAGCALLAAGIWHFFGSRASGLPAASDAA